VQEDALRQYVTKLSEQAAMLESSTRSMNERLTTMRAALVSELASPDLLIPDVAPPTTASLDEYLKLLSGHIASLPASDPRRMRIDRVVQEATDRAGAVRQ
jgi:hypothetical protein